MYSAIANASVSDTLRALLKGQIPTSKPSTLDSQRNTVGSAIYAAAARSAAAAKLGSTIYDQAAASAGVTAASGAAIAEAAQRYIGRPYKWATEGPDTFDCSGLVTWVLHHDLGYNLPSNTHTVTGQFYVWSGAVTVGRPPQAGDLICWPSHIGIAIDSTRMVSAPTAGQNVHISNIYWTPQPLVRRVKPQSNG